MFREMVYQDKTTIYSLSIIVPIYKPGELLTRTLNSFRTQTFKDFEVIIVNGNPLDDKTGELNVYQEEGFNIQYISEVDNGVYDAMNKGIKSAKGNWLYFIGAGDEFYENTTLLKVSKYLTDEIDIVQGDIVIETSKITRYRDKLNGLVLLERNFCHQSIFYHKSVFDRIGIYNIAFPILADWDFNIRWFFNRSIKRYYIDEIICNFLRGGLSATITDSQFLKAKDSIIKTQLAVNDSIKNYLLVFCYYWFQKLSKGNRIRLKRMLGLT